MARSGRPIKEPQQALNFYGLERLGLADSIPLTGVYETDQLTIEMVCFRISHRRSEGGLDRFGHMMEGLRLLWNNDKLGSQKKYIDNPWSAKMLREMCEQDELGISGPTSAGKCISPKTPILRFNGTICRAVEVKSGDVLMGDDSTPRVVQEVHYGNGPMYRVTPQRGNPWECTGNHTHVLYDPVKKIEVEVDTETLDSFDEMNLELIRKYPDGTEEHVPFTLTAIGDGYWVGFSVDGNHRFLLGDFTVTHNSDPAALWAVWCYICDPSATLVMVLSTTLIGAKKRIWKTLREYWQGIPNLPGKPLWSTNEIQGLDYKGEGYGQSSGIYLMASEQSSEKGALDKLIGVKAPRIGRIGATFEELMDSPEYADLKGRFDEEYLRDLIPRLQNLSENRIGKLIMIIDEATGCSESIWNICQSNLKPGNVGHFQLIMLGNAASRWDPFGLCCKPEGGWETVTERDYEWPTASGGLCIRFDGEQNPRITEKNEKFSWMLRAEDIQRMKDTYGENSPYVWRMIKGYWTPEGTESGVYSEADFISNGAMQKAVWGFKQPVRLAALDPAWAAGGDKASCSFGKLGKDPDGLMVLEIEEEIPIKVDINETRVPISHQIVFNWRKECEKRGITPDNAVFDSTGGGGPFGDIVRMEWSSRVMAVSSGGKASKDPLGTEKDANGNLVLGTDRYFNRMTQLWLGAMPFLRSKQLKGITTQLAKQLCSRQYDKGGMSDGRTLRVESKRIFKAREGSSPDESDSYMLLIELAKKRHGFKPAERAPVEETSRKGFGTWKVFCDRARRITINRTLQ